MLTCPNCGYQQSGGDKCQKCSSLFAYYAQNQTPRELSDESAIAARERGSTAGSAGLVVPWRTIYRIARDASLALGVLTLLMIFHKAAPPQVTVDPQAAARAVEKISRAQAAAQEGHPYQVTLDATELNSYLSSNLQLENAAGKSDATASTAPPVNAGANPDATVAPAASPSASATAEPTTNDVQSTVKDVKVDLVNDLVKAYIVFDFHGKDMSLELDGHLSSAEGYLRFEPTAGEIGALPLPQSVLNSAVDKLMSSPENREKLRLPAGVNGIKVKNGQLVIE